MKPFILLQITLTLIFTIASGILAGQRESFSFFAGATLAIFNVLFFAIITRRIFSKKSVATTLLLIIFKYSILGIGLYLIISLNLVNLLWFVIGLSILIPSVIGYVFLFVRLDGKKQSQSLSEATEQKRN
jgi:hypothetical protein